MSVLEQHDLRSLDHLELLARQVVEGFIIGLHKSPFHGFSVEFAEHRLYNPGESVKDIDWKVYARTDRLYVKKYEEETNLRCQIVLDISSSMNYPDAEKSGKDYINKLQFSTVAAASLMNLLRKQRDAFGLTLFDETIHQHTQCKSSMTHYKLMMTYLHKALNEAREEKKTVAAEALHNIADSVHKRSLIIIFSDMFESSEDTDELFSALQHLKHNKHEVILFHVVDKEDELNFDFDNRPYQFIDLESGEKIRLRPGEVKEKYTEKVNAYREELRMRCLQYKIDYVEADIREGFHNILQSYLVKRRKMST